VLPKFRCAPVRLLRQPLSLLLALVLGLSLAACGKDDGSEKTGGKGLDSVQISGDFGKTPQVKWGGQLDVTSTTSKVISEGDGAEVQAGDKVDVQIWIGNGYSQEESYSSFDAQPQALTVDSKSLSKVFIEGLQGHTIGSRVAVAAPASAAFGSQGNPQLGIGNKDSVVIILDIIGEHVDPKPKDVAASKLPSLVEKKGEPVGFDFSHVDKPAADGDLLRTVLKEGDGPVVTTDMTITADYLGEVYGAKKPFDESYSKKPAAFPLTQVVQGWTYGLSGLKVGSRVLLQIPPDLGYGDQGQSGIPAGSTLYFVIDIRKAQ
jgi:peptidylprolyl isomerase